MPPPSLDIGNGWIAIRDIKSPSTGWYFYRKADKTNQFEPPPVPFLQHLPDANDLLGVSMFLDSELRSKKPELSNQLTPLQTAAEFFARRTVGGVEKGTSQAEAKKVVLKISGEKKEVDPRIEAARSQFGALFLFDENPTKSAPVSSVVAEPLFGPGSWTSEVYDAGLTFDKSLQAISNAILASAPTFENNDSLLSRDWQSLLVSSLSKPDAIHEGETLQRLSSSAKNLCDNPGARSAIAFLLAAGSRFPTSQTALILDAFQHSSDSSTLVRSVSIFANRYTSQAGKELVRTVESNKWIPSLLAVIEDAQWRRTLIELSDRSASNLSPDPFLDIAISTIAESPYRKEASGAAALASDIPFFESLSTNLLRELGLTTLISRSKSIAPIISSEISSLLALFSLSTLSDRIRKAKSGFDIDHLFGGFLSLRCESIREELGYGILRRDGLLSSSVAVLPADADVMLEAAAYAPELNVGFTESTVRGAEGEESSSVFDACLLLRKASVDFFITNGGRDDFFPIVGGVGHEHDAFAVLTGPISSLNSPLNTTVPLSSLLSDSSISLTENASMSIDSIPETAPGENTKTETDLSSRNNRGTYNCAKPLDNSSILEVLRALDVIKGVQFDLQMISELKARKAEADSLKDESLYKFMEIADEATAQETAFNAKLSHAIDSILLAFAHAARILRQPDVIALLLHLSMCPTVSLGPAIETVASALSWALNVASDDALYEDECRTNIGYVEPTRLVIGPCGVFLAPKRDYKAQSSSAHDVMSRYKTFGTSIMEINKFTHAKSGFVDKLKKVSSPFPPPDTLEYIEEIEAQMCMFGLSHPTIAIGLLHWLKQVSFILSSQDDSNTCSRSFPIFARICVAFTHRWPLLIQSTLDLFLIFLNFQVQLSNESGSVKNVRHAVVECLVHLFQSTGFQVHVVQFCIDFCKSGGDVDVLRNLITLMCQSVDCSNTSSSFFSHDFAFAFSKLVLMTQKRIFTEWDSGPKRQDIKSISNNTTSLKNVLLSASRASKQQKKPDDELEVVLREIEKGVV